MLISSNTKIKFDISRKHRTEATCVSRRYLPHFHRNRTRLIIRKTGNYQDKIIDSKLRWRRYSLSSCQSSKTPERTENVYIHIISGKSPRFAMWGPYCHSNYFLRDFRSRRHICTENKTNRIRYVYKDDSQPLQL